MQAFHFCAPEIHFDLSTRPDTQQTADTAHLSTMTLTRPQYPRFEFSVPASEDLRLLVRLSTLPCNQIMHVKMINQGAVLGRVSEKPFRNGRLDG